MEQNILIPFGSSAGKTADAAEVIRKLTGEVALQAGIVGSLYHKTDNEWDRKQFLCEYRYLEKVLTILFAIYYQMEPRAWEADPRYGLIPAAEAHKLVLPDWMKMP